MRPLVDLSGDGKSLQKVSREHHIDQGPGSVTIAAGGKYTTHRKMAQEIVDFMISGWRADARHGKCERVPSRIGSSRTKLPINPKALADAVAEARQKAMSSGLAVDPVLYERYGAEALDVAQLQSQHASVRASGGAKVATPPDPAGFPLLEAQLRHGIRTGMVLRLEDFYFRRTPLFASRADHGMPWAEALSRIWAEERELPASAAEEELKRLRAEVAHRSAWINTLS